MGYLNTASTFVSTMNKLKMEWETLVKERGLKNVASEIIVDDVLLYGIKVKKLIEYFRTVMEILKHYRATINLKR